MEVRCGGCTKLFRVSDDKITGLGIKFACSRCGNAVKITSEEFEQYKLSQEAVSALASFEPKPAAAVAAATAAAVPVLEEGAPGGDAPHPDFDLSDPASAAAAMATPHEEPPVFVKPEAPAAVQPAPAPKAEPKPAPAVSAPAAPIPQAPAPPKIDPKPAPVRPAQPDAKSAPKPKPAAPVRPASMPGPSPSIRRKETERPAPVVVMNATSQGTSSGTKIAIVLAAVVLLAAGAFFAKSFLGGKSPSRQAINLSQEVTPEGLQVMNASGSVDPLHGDLIISGVIENGTDKPRPAWYVVVDVYDAQGATLTKGKVLNGKQIYTRRDEEILSKRGVNMEEFKLKQLQEQGIVIPAGGKVNFEVRILEPPVGMASFNATLQPFDPVKLHKEISEAQK